MAPPDRLFPGVGKICHPPRRGMPRDLLCSAATVVLAVRCCCQRHCRRLKVKDADMRNISDTIRRLRAGKYTMPPSALGPWARPSRRSAGLRFQPRDAEGTLLRPAGSSQGGAAGRRPAWLHPDGRRLRPWIRLVASGRPAWLCLAVCGAAAIQQPQSVLQLVRRGRHPARRRRGAVDPPDDRGDRRRAPPRPPAHLRHRALGRRRHGVGDAGRLPRGLRRRRDHRRPALSLRRDDPRGVRQDARARHAFREPTRLAGPRRLRP